MKRYFTLILISTIALIISSCDINKSGSAVHPLEEQSGVVFTLVSQTDKPIKDIRIYGFNASGLLAIYKEYSSVDALASSVLSLPSGVYTFVEVLNVGEDFTPDISKSAKISSEELPTWMFSDFTAWLKEASSLYPDMMTGISRAETSQGLVTHVVADIKNGTEGLNSSLLRLNVKFPEGEMPDFKSKSLTKTSGYDIRATVEIYQKDSIAPIYSRNEILSSSTLELNLQPGDYDILLWTDYVPATKTHVADHYYTTSSLKGVEFSETITYTANANSRSAYSLAFEATVSADSFVTERTVTLVRPFAKYRIVATDLEQYGQISGSPALVDLVVSVSYAGDLPNRFDVSANKPIATIEGVKYSNSVYDITATTATVGSDFVFVNEADSFVTVNIVISDKNSGRKITQVLGVKIDYRRDQLTTVSGAFLTAGISTSGITINTEWDGDNDHDF